LFYGYRLRLTRKNSEKFLWLQHTHREILSKKIKPIRYSYVLNNTNTDGNNNLKFIISGDKENLKHTKTTINIEADKFKNIAADPLRHTNSKWFINLTNVLIPEKVSNLLQMGGNFSLPIDHSSKKKVIHEFIKDTENHNKHISETVKSKIRNTIIPFFHRLVHNKNSKHKIENTLKDLKNATIKFCNSNPNIVFTRADKGNVTVAINKDEYINKIEIMLQDQDTYIPIKKNPIKSIEKSLNNTLKKWFQNNYITKQTYFKLFSSDSDLPKAYGLPKIHKKDHPFRIIVSSINTAFYPLASYLQAVLTSSLTYDNKQVKNSFELYKTLSGTKISDTHMLISLDVVSLFTNIPQDLAINSIIKRWAFIKLKTNIPKNEFIEAIKLILSSTYFVFNKKIYRQTYGTPMGSPLSPIIAHMVLQDLEEEALEKINCNIPFYFRYVDDIVLAAPIDQIKKIVDTFNAFHDRLQFTVELEDKKKFKFYGLEIRGSEQRDGHRLVS